MPRGSAQRHPAKRGVYVSDFTVNGHHWVYSVMADGEQLAFKSRLPEEVEATVGDLWTELDRMDAIPLGVSSLPSLHRLRLV